MIPETLTNQQHHKLTRHLFISETLILWSLQMSFSYLYILQRQWNRDVNSIFDSAKTSGPHGIVCFNCSQSCSLHRLFFRHSCAGRDRSLCTAAITNLASCVWLKTSMPSMNNIFVWLGKSRYWIIWSELSQAPSRLSGTAPAGKLRSNI